MNRRNVANPRVIRKEAHQRVTRNTRALVVIRQVVAANPKSGNVRWGGAQHAQRLVRTRIEFLVGVEHEDPALGRQRQRLVARPSEIVAPRTLDHSRTERRAISSVRSVDPVSTMHISSTCLAALRRQASRNRSSFLTIMHKLMPAGNCTVRGGGR